MAAKSASSKTGATTRALTDVKALARVLKQFDLSELELEAEGVRISLKRQSVTLSPAAVAPAAEMPQAEASAAARREVPAADEPGAVGADGQVITSPLVGTFYRAPSPDSGPFVEVGQAVRKGHTLCIIEAMKLMNEIEAESDGRVLEVLVSNGDPVEYGQPLFRFAPA